MVLPGQFLERNVVVPSGGLLLDALYHRGAERPACALAAPHPALGGSMQVPVIAELAFALSQAGHSTLRFDYRGVGASQGSSRHKAGALGRIALDKLADEVADMGAAMEQLCATAGVAAGCAVGYSFGSAVALACAADPRVEELVLIAPPTRLIDFAPLAQVHKPVLVVLAHHDDLCDRARVQEWLAPLGEKGTLAVIANADHVFRRGLRELGHEVVSWLWRDRSERPARARRETAEEPGQALFELSLPDEGEPPLELDDR